MNLRVARVQKRMTQWDVRRLTGISPTKISLIENAHIKASEDEKALIANALGMPVTEINWLESGVRKPEV